MRLERKKFTLLILIIRTDQPYRETEINASRIFAFMISK